MSLVLMTRWIGWRQSKSFQLVRPLGRWVAQTGLADATGQAAFDCRLDKIRRNERHRDRHVHMTNAALVVCGNLLNPGCRAGYQLLQPSPAARDRLDQA